MPELTVGLSQRCDFGELVEQTSEMTSVLCLKYDVVISRTFAGKDDMETLDLPLYMNIRREGIPI